jgi:hypothetical protein
MVGVSAGPGRIDVTRLRIAGEMGFGLLDVSESH